MEIETAVSVARAGVVTNAKVIKLATMFMAESPGGICARKVRTLSTRGRERRFTRLRGGSHAESAAPPQPAAV
jgi:hypothetical protein